MMKMSQISFGQAEESCPESDKWILLETLTSAAPSFGLNHRTLGVLKALLSFFPQRTLPRDPGKAIVFPSNRTLSQRLNGMPESTLRRHLALLVKSGIVSRQDSPNRKRYTRRFGLTFGFDLSPLARAATTLIENAQRADEQRQRLIALREQVAVARARLLNGGNLPETHPLMQETRLILRRKPDETVLLALLEELKTYVEIPLPHGSASEEMSGADDKNERHKQNTNESESVNKDQHHGVVLSDLLSHCKEYSQYFPNTAQSWHGVITVADRLYQMMGIDRPGYEKAQRKLGVKPTATIILCMLERLSAIRKPGAYLHELSRRGEIGTLNLPAMVHAQSVRKLSADNRRCKIVS